MLWIPITVAAASLQVARNAFQRGLLAGARPWGATLVRFLFGLPFSALFVIVAIGLAPHAQPTFSRRFWLACAIGGGAQILGTAAMLVSMRRSSFALGTVFQQSGIPLAAVFGAAFGDHLSPARWFGLALVAAALAVLSWPRGGARWSAAPLGLAAGAGFALASNAYRQSALALDPTHPVLAAQITLFTVQAMQSAALVAWLALRDRAALIAAVRPWRASLAAGFFGAAASGLWFTAFALSPAGPVRAVGVVEAPVAALAGRRVFAEKLSPWQWLAAITAACGVGLAALG
ncbi:MAG TPA: EamA/RhaT family transporter [Phenylobacterium sp.]|uniref:EamA/RhaT family transporter n=1 Tax=Phenylobacterium sp. TaxID=1871053 RepID=UPI002D369070|nr:EamA/RhaT family transporter [Phenylobacterium sp.]HZZ67793.1 EamA/RhaT family transporter [Phenylobacterium sp.]